jgi:tetratricopeptide (TPR) repeat protein
LKIYVQQRTNYSSQFLRQLLLVPLLLGLSLPVNADERSDHFRNVGQQLYDQKRYVDSINAFGQAIQLKPKDASLYALRSNAYEKCNKYTQAADDLRTSMKLDPNNADYCLKYADLGDPMNDQHQAIDGYTRYLAIKPDDFSILSDRAFKYRMLNDFDHAFADSTAAIATAKKIKAKKSHIAEQYKRRGQLLAWHKEYERAVADFSSGLEIIPDDLSIHKNRGTVYVALRQKDKALVDFNYIIAKEDKKKSLLVDLAERAQIYYDLKDYPKALADTNKILSLESEQIDGYTMRAKTYDAMGKHDLAKKDRDTAQKITAEWVPKF